MYCKVVWKMLTANRLNDDQCEMNWGSVISIILEKKSNQSYNSNKHMWKLQSKLKKHTIAKGNYGSRMW